MTEDTIFHKCRRCKKLRMVLRETGYWYDLLCQECEIASLENDEDYLDWIE